MNRKYKILLKYISVSIMEFTIRIGLYVLSALKASRYKICSQTFGTLTVLFNELYFSVAEHLWLSLFAAFSIKDSNNISSGRRSFIIIYISLLIIFYALDFQFAFSLEGDFWMRRFLHPGEKEGRSKVWYTDNVFLLRWMCLSPFTVDFRFSPYSKFGS